MNDNLMAFYQAVQREIELKAEIAFLADLSKADRRLLERAFWEFAATRPVIALTTAQYLIAFLLRYGQWPPAFQEIITVTASSLASASPSLAAE